jgi:hypothetical protein
MMKKIFALLLMAVLFQACEESQEVSSIDPINWEKKDCKRDVK